jgi:hypothetical protein
MRNTEGKISLVIQGPIQSNDYNCIDNINEIYDRCRKLSNDIILSTYSHDDLDKINKNINIVANKIPQELCKKNDINGIKFFNRNLQALSSLNGIKRSKNKYSLKIRTDQLYNYENIFKEIDELLEDRIFHAGFINHTPFCYCDFITFSNSKRLYQFYSNILKHSSIVFMQNSRLSEIDYILKDLIEIEIQSYPNYYFFPRIEKYTNSDIYKKYPKIIWEMFINLHNKHYDLFNKEIFTDFYWRGINCEERFKNDKNRICKKEFELYLSSLKSNVMLDNNDKNIDFLYFFQIEKAIKYSYGIENSDEYRNLINNTSNIIYSNRK